MRPWGVEFEQTLDAVGLGFEFEHDIVALGEKRHQLGRKAEQRVEGQAVGQFSGPDAELLPGLTVNHGRQLVQQLVHIGIDGQQRVVGQIVLEKAVAAVHRAVRDQADDQIVAAHQTGRAGRAMFEKTGTVAGEQERLFAGAEGVRQAFRRRPVAPVYESDRQLGQALQRALDNGRVFFSPFDQHVLRLIAVHGGGAA